MTTVTGNKNKKEKVYIIISVIFLILTIITESIFFYIKIQNHKLDMLNAAAPIDQERITSLIQEFGQHLKNVYLTSPEEEIKKEIQENYRDFLSPNLLELWQNDPSKALGRITSSPWPDRIEVTSLSRTEEGIYLAIIKIIYMTSEEMVNGEIADSKNAFLKIKKINGQWFIDDIKVAK